MNQRQAVELKRFIIMLPICFILIITLIKFEIIPMANNLNERKEVVTNIISLNYENETEGSFGYGFGRVEGVPYFVCYRCLKDGGKRLWKIEAENAVIYNVLESNETAYVKVTENGYGQELKYKIYVPKNAIEVKYNFN